MTGEFKRLFEPIRIGKVEIPNRFVFAATGTHYANKDGTVSERVTNFLLRRARGGLGMIVVEYTEVDRDQQASSRALQIYDDRFIEGLSRLTKVIKSEGVAVALQLHHPGRYSDTRISGNQAVAPSAVKSRILREAPRELTDEEIWDLVDKFVEGVRRTKEAGFDAVEFHGATGYLIHQFFSPEVNRRQDAWGGDTERRCKFMKEIVARAREKVGKDFPFILRLAVEDYIEGGLKLEESKEIVLMMEKIGIDSISVTAGTHDSSNYSTAMLVPSMFLPRATFADFSAEIKKIAKTPVMVAGRIDTPRLAEKILEENKADLICMCRALICDPDLPKKAREGRSDKIRRCLYDNTCTDTITRGVPGAALACLMNPEVGREYVSEPKTDQVRKVLILGGGPAGLEAARVARTRGHIVAIFDENPRLGGRWSWMIKPYVIDRQKILQKLGVELRLGKPPTLEAVREWSPDIVIATKPLKPIVPNIPGIEKTRWCVADTVFSEEPDVKGEVVVIGGNNVGLEVADLLSKKGNHVTVLEESWSGRGISRMMRNHYFERLSKHGVKILSNTRISEVRNGKVVFVDKTMKEQTVDVDWVVVALLAEIDNEPIAWLEGQSFQVFYIDPTQSPRDWIDAFLDGTTIGRKI